MKTENYITQGEWKITKIGSYSFSINGINNRPIVSINSSKYKSMRMPIEEAEANAKLIASAPEMLEMLKIVKEHFLKMDNGHCDHRITEVINKATE